jgi:hypothetical protein
VTKRRKKIYDALKTRPFFRLLRVLHYFPTRLRLRRAKEYTPALHKALSRVRGTDSFRFVIGESWRPRLTRGQILLEKRLRFLSSCAPHVLSEEETIEYVIEHRCSIARLGDGEMKALLLEPDEDKTIARKSTPLNEFIVAGLRRVAKEGTTENCLVCINAIPQSIHHSRYLRYYYLCYFNEPEYFFESLNYHCSYGDAYAFQLLAKSPRGHIRTKEIWRDRDAVFVGNDVNFDLDSPAFDNVRSKALIQVPVLHACLEYERIKSEILSYPKESIFILAVGPTATLLVHELSKTGRQLIDLGRMTPRIDKNETLQSFLEHARP